MSLQTMAAFLGGWILGYLYPATATENSEICKPKKGEGRDLWQKQTFLVLTQY